MVAFFQETAILLSYRQKTAGKERKKSMYQYAAQNRHATGNFRLRYRVLLTAVVLLLAATAVLAAMTISGNSFKSRSRDQYAQAMSNNAANALSVANRMDSVTVSTTSQRLGLIRQYIYAMEQVNRLSIQMFGEGGRYVPDNAFTALYQDLDNYETVVQSAKVSTVEVRELLINHLKLVQGYINGDIVS